MDRDVPLQIELKHHFTSEQKLEWWGNGEWVEEPDQAIFSYGGFHCMVKRVMIAEDKEMIYISGGHLSGCVEIPYDHPWALDDALFGDENVHGGITFSEGNDEAWVIGFECAHSHDVVPSIKLNDTSMREIFLKKRPAFRQQQMDMLSSLFDREYRNMDFCINECMKLVEKAKEASNRAINYP